MVGVVLLEFLRMLLSVRYVRSGIMFFHPGLAYREYLVKTIIIAYKK